MKVATWLGACAFLLAVEPPGGLAQPPRRAPTPNDTLVSPEVHRDHKVTFRIYAPKAEAVTVSGDWLQGGGPVKLDKADNGVWSATVGPLTPDYYSYTFSVDDVHTLDPKNPTVKQGIGSLDNMVWVPGKEAEFEADKAKPGQTVVVNEGKLANLKRSIYALIPGIPLGVIGGVLALTRKGKIAALLLLIAYVVPVSILVVGVGLDFSENLVKIILAAPAGFGKTTLLGDWSRHTGRATAWVSLDEGDNDPTRFWVYVVAALEQLHPGLGQGALAVLVHAFDDPIPVQDSLLMGLALKQAGVPAELHLYASGGHGFGLRPSRHPCSSWPQRCAEWMRDQRILTGQALRPSRAASVGPPESRR